MIDRRPAVVRAAGTCRRHRGGQLAREHGLLLAVRGGGHNIAGIAVCDGGLLHRPFAMQSVRVDPETRTARVEPGAPLADFDREAQTYGLATPLGINSTTGIAGLTLGGGFGWITRKYGLTIDNLISADVVTADGESCGPARGEPGSVLGAARRRRQLRRGHLVRVPAPPAGPRGPRRPRRPSVRRGDELLPSSAASPPRRPTS